MEVVCAQCETTALKTKTEKGNRVRLPNGWKLVKNPLDPSLNRLLCGKCHGSWVTRTIKIPIGRAIAADHIVEVQYTYTKTKDGKKKRDKKVTRVCHRHLDSSEGEETHKLIQKCL